MYLFIKEVRDLGISSWFSNLLKKTKIVALDVNYGAIEAEAFYKQIAIESCINLISNTLSKSEFLTFEKGEEVRKENYYLFNIKPNQNVSSCEFWKKAIYKLYIENELLIVQINSKFYIADTFEIKEFALNENIYKNVKIDSYLTSDSFKESEVFHLKLNNNNVKTIIDALYSSYGKLIEASYKNYIKSNLKRGILEMPVRYIQTEKGQEDLKDLMEKRFQKFFDSDKDSVLPLTDGFKYSELDSKGKSAGEVRVVRSYIDDIFDFVALAFQVPPQLLKGDVADTEKAMNNFFTFCINPLAKLISDEINMKFYSKEDYLERTYVKLDTSKIRVTTLKDIANALDVLTRIGAFTINDSLRALGKEPIGDSWASERYMTKNYEKIKEGGV